MQCPDELLNFGASDAALPFLRLKVDHVEAKAVFADDAVNAFVACHHPNSAQHSVPFLICDRCHSAVELEDRDVVAALDARAKALGFQPQAQTLEVHGLCARCAAA